MRTLRPTVLSLALAVVLTACTGGVADEASSLTASAPEEVDVDADFDTAEVLSTSAATVEATDGLGADVVPAAASLAAKSETTEASAAPEFDVPLASFALRRGETLAHYARWAELPVETIAKASELDLDGMYQVGTEVKVPVDDAGLAELTTRRESHHQARAEAYLKSRGGSPGNQLIAVRTGDTAWSIAKDNEGIPVWLLETLNPQVDLDRLRPGQELIVPQIGEGTVAEVEAAPDAAEPEVELLADEDEVGEPLVEEISESGELDESAEDDASEPALDVSVLPEMTAPGVE